jgi:hypothetical protein
MLELSMAFAIFTSQGAPSYSSSADGTLVTSEEIDYTGLSGYQEDQYQFEITPGDAPISVNWGSRSRAAWGSSYAISSEIFQLYYQGRAKAAANVYLDKRIIQVCIWYTRNSVFVSSKVCSNASASSGYWTAGPEVSVGAWDSIGLNDPKTIFNISTSRIAPNAIF